MNIDILKSFVSGEFVDDNVSFIGKLESGTLGKELKFPLSESDCLEHLLPLSSKAYFGKNDKSVLDPEYRKAQVIYPNSFFCNFDPNNYDIIDKIQTSMGESVNNIKFVRDKKKENNEYIVQLIELKMKIANLMSQRFYVGNEIEHG